MKQRDIIILVLCTVVIIGVLVLLLGRSKPSSSASGPQPPHVTPVNPNFDQKTISEVKQNFPVNLDLTGLGKPDPFSGI